MTSTINYLALKSIFPLKYAKRCHKTLKAVHCNNSQVNKMSMEELDGGRIWARSQPVVAGSVQREVGVSVEEQGWRRCGTRALTPLRQGFDFSPVPYTTVLKFIYFNTIHVQRELFES